jgi:hypothetical protein
MIIVADTSPPLHLGLSWLLRSSAPVEPRETTMALAWAVPAGGRATLRPVADTNVDEIYTAIRGLPITERLKLVERVVHDITEAHATGPVKRDPRAIIGAFADIPDVVDEICEAAMAARGRDPLRLSNG